ncbi:hypothetical protein [Bosea vaviloviae]|uniref:EAL domain-containing protein n=1 Tax=Bosea vaviloviae TaxID=1526658 RepID=A0A1D7U7W3_9HYPH|nr:hypothetical protein [Bosea vaviloviae]AOO83465.1 hypothetical protein BHK69_26180 [Bosea vaviloviae]
MIEAVLSTDDAKRVAESLRRLRQIGLSDAANTDGVALRLYERLGFKPYGIESKALRIDGTFFDEALLALDFSEAAPD